MYPRMELNHHLMIRNHLFYPLNYGGNWGKKTEFLRFILWGKQGANGQIPPPRNVLSYHNYTTYTVWHKRLGICCSILMSYEGTRSIRRFW